ncbi:unnamed protein product [Thelazia callipaeda]|uniref:Mannosyltransferase n=1 Tax=Thelazia callipaeda TaxID=103827 RepID=A0A0N5D437_THECL|nr:unnamed protein product [Thelazia callipaeda]
MATPSSIQNLNKPKDAFELLEDEEGTRQGFCHIRIQQRTGRKTITTVQGIAPEYDLKKIVRYLKKVIIFRFKYPFIFTYIIFTCDIDLTLIFITATKILLPIIFCVHYSTCLCLYHDYMVDLTIPKVMSRKLLYGLILLRIINVFFIRTYFVPDELFQSVEVAHWAVYGTGYLSWEWIASIRSVLHPAIIGLLYFVGCALSIDSAVFIIQAPRVLHALLFAFSDYFYYKLCKRIVSSNTAKYALMSYLSSWFVWYCAPRTLSNTLETALTIVALQWYPLSTSDLKRSCGPYMSIGLITLLIRPTAILIWIPFGLWHLWRAELRVKLLLHTCLPSCLPILLFVVLLDSVAYGKFTVTIWNFIRFNVLEGGSDHFGSHSWHWFISQGLPVILTVHLIPMLFGIIIAVRKRLIPLPFLWIPVLYIMAHSFIAHKEHRFLLPVIPMLYIFVGIFFSHISKQLRNFLMVLLMVVNVFLALYFGLIHQVGTFSATSWISKDAQSRFHEEKHFVVLQLMPCFSLPQYSYFHNFNITITALDCSPNLLHKANYVDQADFFHENPKQWISENLNVVNKSDYIVFYEKIYREEYNCNGTTVDHPEYGEVIQLTGDQRQHIKDFLCRVGIVKEENCKIHGF